MPGAGKQSSEVQAQIKELLEAGFDPTTIHRRLKVGRSSIYRMKRCLQQHGTAYMPTELNKKNGRPKVLTAEQELEVRDWLANPQNRTRFLDDLVWLIHDRFDIVCSTTTMSKIRRKWLHAIKCEETGRPLDDAIRAQLTETHPNLPILHQSQFEQQAPPAQMVGQLSQPPPYPTDTFTHPSVEAQEQISTHMQNADDGLDPDITGLPPHVQHTDNDLDPSITGLHHPPESHMDPSLEQHYSAHSHNSNKAEMDFRVPPYPPPPHQQQHMSSIDAKYREQLQQLNQQHAQHKIPSIDDKLEQQLHHHHHHQQQMTDPRLQQEHAPIDEQLERQLQRGIASV